MRPPPSAPHAAPVQVTDEDVRADVLRAAYARLSAGDVAGFCSAWLDPDVITIDPALGNPVGTAAVFEEYGALRRGCPSAVWRVDEVLAVDRHTVALVSVRPAAGGPAVLHLCEVAEWQGGVAVTRRLYRTG